MGYLLTIDLLTTAQVVSFLQLVGNKLMILESFILSQNRSTLHCASTASACRYETDHLLKALVLFRAGM